MKNKLLLLFTFGIITFLCLYKLGQQPLSQWDEARRAINAMEMIRTGDLVNLYYRGLPEVSNFKPPFVVWCEALSFRLFGVGECLLRLPSALAMIVAFFVLFKIITLYRSPRFAAWTCLMLASVKGLIGWHVSRTGDTDSMLVLFLLLSVFFSLRVIDFGRRKSAYWAGLFIGLAFLTKGPAAWVLLPGLALYALLTKKIQLLIKQKETWMAIGLVVAFPVIWFLLKASLGAEPYPGHSKSFSFKRLFSKDIWERFSQTTGQEKMLFDPQFFFYSLDKMFNVWNYLFFIALAFGLVFLFSSRSRFISFLIKDERQKLLMLSLCLYFPLALFLALAADSHSWYMAPVIPFAGIVTFWFIRHFWHRSKFVKYAFGGILAFTLGRQVALFSDTNPKPSFIVENASTFQNARTIYVDGEIELDVLAYLYFFEKDMQFDMVPCPLEQGSVIVQGKFSEAARLCNGIKLIADDGKYRLYK
ncbi:MAG: hypothetical protein CMN32_00435 [Saprospirales bacterium]|nr:hypothetical protein [Saprospirales bacterium]